MKKKTKTVIIAAVAAAVCICFAVAAVIGFRFIALKIAEGMGEVLRVMFEEAIKSIFGSSVHNAAESIADMIS